ncbi:hypothetical protein FACS18949_02550 [Clostridia bacterium]|nr:hypothetical protein FACS18949_02550 [Clostridia bacterium]
MYCRDCADIFSLIGTVGEMLAVIDRVSKPADALDDCVAAVDTICAILLLERLRPTWSLTMLGRLRADFVSLRGTELTPAHSNSLKYYLGLILEKLRGELQLRYNVLLLPHKSVLWPHMRPIYEAARRDPECDACVVPIPYTVPDMDDTRLICERTQFPSEMPMERYSELKLDEFRPDLILINDPAGLSMMIHEPFRTAKLRENCLLLLSLPSLRELPEDLREGFLSIAEGAEVAIGASLLANIKAILSPF